MVDLNKKSEEPEPADMEGSSSKAPNVAMVFSILAIIISVFNIALCIHTQSVMAETQQTLVELNELYSQQPHQSHPGPGAMRLPSQTPPPPMPVKPTMYDLYGPYARYSAIYIGVPEGSSIWDQLDQTVRLNTPKLSDNERIIGNMVAALRSQYPSINLDVIPAGFELVLHPSPVVAYVSPSSQNRTHVPAPRPAIQPAPPVLKYPGPMVSPAPVTPRVR